MMGADAKPSEPRLLAAFALATLVPSVFLAVALATWGEFGGGFSFAGEGEPKLAAWLLGVAIYGLAALTFALPLTGVLGTLCYFLLRRFLAPRIGWALLVGALIPSIPYAIFILAILAAGVDEPAVSVLSDGLKGSISLAIFGAIGGATFWTVLARPRTRHSDRRSPPPGGDI